MIWLVRLSTCLANLSRVGSLKLSLVLCRQKFAKHASHCQKELRYSVLKDMLVPDECQSVKRLL